ncbi:NAD(P)-binding domain-containing protein [Streptomyces ziwulingensis]|uniref:6-phosphogluconate dehydrogenase NADP-binding domain-containing protein n=1 Tax=Streptomyces ziwulingensis TaxID=1045501 RepID=A0ABP9D231_9ACTN
MELGFVGAGRVGRPMVRRLVRAGHRVRVHARGAEACAALAGDGAEPVASLAAAARGADAVLVRVRTDAQVREVCLDGALIPALPAGSVLAVHTTGDPRTVRVLADRGGVGGLAASAAPFLRKDLAVVTGLAADLGLSLGPLEAAVRALEELLPGDG